MPYLTARTTSVSVDVFKNFLIKEGCSQIIYNEECPPSDNLHNHWLFWIDKEIKSFKQQRTRSKELKEFKGNSFISIQVLKKTKEDYLQYMCKGYNVTKPYSEFIESRVEPKVYGLEDDQVLENNLKFWEQYKVLSSVIETKKKELTKSEKFLKYALGRCADEGVGVDDFKELCAIVINYFGRIAKEPFCEIIVHKHLNLLRAQLDIEYFTNRKSDFIEKLRRRDVLHGPGF